MILFNEQYTNKNNMKRKIILFLLIITHTVFYGQEIVRIASYNVKQFPGSNSHAAEFKTVINEIKPDILMLTELDGSGAVQSVLSNVLTSKYKASTEVSILWGNGNECAVFYRDSLFTYLGSTMITATTRPIAQFKLVHKITLDTLIIFGVHLKANTSGPSDLTKRASAVDSLRKKTRTLSSKSNFVVLGDFNILTSSEPAFQKLLDQTLPGYVYDPLNSVGDWANNSAFAAVHTESATDLTARFDMILISQGVKDLGGVEYINGSFKIMGNDGLHYSKNITSSPANYWFASNPALGTAITAASDHLPVYADFRFGALQNNVSVSNPIPDRFELKQNYPNPFNPGTVIGYNLPKAGYVTLKVYDILGRELITLVNEFQQAGTYNYSVTIRRLLDHSQLSSSVYFYSLHFSNSEHTFLSTKKMILLK